MTAGCESDIRAELLKLGLNPDQTLSAWAISARSLQAAAHFNLRTLRGLRDREPSAVPALAEEFGILNFGRYPEGTLVDQFKGRSDSSPYIVWACPYFDVNGALYKFGDQFTHPLELLHRSLRQLNVNLRFFEYGDEKSFTRRLNAIAQRFGPAAGGVFGGHGSESTLGLYFRENECFSVLQQPRAKELRSFFVSGPTVVLLSCYTGAEGGFGQHLSAAFKAKVIAPRHRTSLDRIWPVLLEDGRLDLRVQYCNDTSIRYNDYPLRGDQAVYVSGQLQTIQ